MKKLIILALITIMFSCKKESEQLKQTPQKTGEVCFHMGAYPINEGHWDLLIDGEDKGALKMGYPDCSTPTFIHVTLSVGQHRVNAKSLDGVQYDNEVLFTVVEGCEMYKVK